MTEGSIASHSDDLTRRRQDLTDAVGVSFISDIEIAGTIHGHIDWGPERCIRRRATIAAVSL